MTLICPVCEQNKLLFKSFVLPAYTIYTCKHCLTRFSQPFVINKDVYSDNFIKAKQQYLNTTVINDKAYDGLNPFLNLSGEKILDIGCGTGSFLRNFKSHNEVLGIEVSEAYRQYLEANGIPHRIGNLEDILSSIPDNYFDLITLWDVFEHLEAPGKLLATIKKKLSPEGFIIIWTNNYDDFISLFAEAVYTISLGKLHVLIQKSFNREGGHNYNFVSKSLELLYQKNKLKIVISIKTDTPSKKLTNNILFRGILELFYLMNKLTGKGKIICHILKHDEV